MKTDCIYIRDGALMKKDIIGEYFVIDEITKEDIFKSIENYMLSHPKEFKLSKIILSSVKTLADVSKCKHCRIPLKSQEKSVFVDDPLYIELEKFIQNSEIFNKNFEDIVYIKNGTLMKQHFNGDFFLVKEVSKEDVFSCIETYLLTHPEELKLCEIIFASVKAACNVSKCRHCKLTFEKNGKQVTEDDPLYIEFVKFIQSSDVYKETFDKKQKKREKEKLLKEEKQKKKAVESALNGFQIEGVRKYLRTCRK